MQHSRLHVLHMCVPLTKCGPPHFLGGPWEADKLSQACEFLAYISHNARQTHNPQSDSIPASDYNVYIAAIFPTSWSEKFKQSSQKMSSDL